MFFALLIPEGNFITEGKSIAKEATGNEKENTHAQPEVDVKHAQPEVNGEHGQAEVNVKHAQAEVTLNRVSRCWSRWVFCLACYNVSTVN